MPHGALRHRLVGAADECAGGSQAGRRLLDHRHQRTQARGLAVRREGGPETTLPHAGRVPGVPEASHLYIAPGQDEAEAVALVGTVIVDVTLVPVSNKETTALKPTIEALLRSAVRLVRAAESKVAS